MPMKNPPHPGEIIRDLYIEPLGLTVTHAAEGLGATRKTMSLLLNGHAGISPEMALRLSQAFGRSPEKAGCSFRCNTILPNSGNQTGT